MRDKKGSTRNKPLLYIVQPEFEMSRNEEPEYVLISNQATEEIEENEQDIVEDTPILVDDDNNKETTERKGFNNKTVLEKINFLVNLPHQLPKLTVEVITEEEKYRGVIYEKVDEVIKVKTLKAPYNFEININDVEEIQIVSL
jgi:hypothetical protein